MGTRPNARPASQPFHAGSACGNGFYAPRPGTWSIGTSVADAR